MAGRQVLEPSIEVEIRLADTARPEPLHEHPITVVRSSRLVRSLDLDHHAPRFSTMPLVTFRSHELSARIVAMTAATMRSQRGPRKANASGVARLVAQDASDGAVDSLV